MGWKSLLCHHKHNHTQTSRHTERNMAIKSKRRVCHCHRRHIKVWHHDHRREFDSKVYHHYHGHHRHRRHTKLGKEGFKETSLPRSSQTQPCCDFQVLVYYIG